MKGAIGRQQHRRVQIQHLLQCVLPRHSRHQRVQRLIASRRLPTSSTWL
jgi:hypothetical protein